MAPGRAEPDFGLQGWIDTLGLKQIFLIYSEYSPQIEGNTQKHPEYILFPGTSNKQQINKNKNKSIFLDFVFTVVAGPFRKMELTQRYMFFSD